MAGPSKNGKTMIEYDCRDGVYSIDNNTVKPLGYLVAIQEERQVDTQDKFGDGEIMFNRKNDKGSNGSLELTAHDEDFEIDLGFLKRIKNGLAEVQILQDVPVSIGAKCYITVKDRTTGRNVTKTKKVWWINISVSPASYSLSQSTDGSNEATASYPISIKGLKIMGEDGVSEYVDENGNTQKVFRLSRVPGEDGYETFLDSVPTLEIN